jgi:hypothetical protein
VPVFERYCAIEVFAKRMMLGTSFISSAEEAGKPTTCSAPASAVRRTWTKIEHEWLRVISENVDDTWKMRGQGRISSDQGSMIASSSLVAS